VNVANMSNPDMEQIWNEVSSGLKYFILSKVENEADASDILQDTFLKIHGNIHTLKDQYKLKSGIYQIARNQINDYFRTNKDYKNTNEIPDVLTFTDSSDRLMDRAISDMVSMMDELSPEYCEALCLTEIDGMSQKEYAEAKGLSYSGAKSRVQRARVILKDMLLKCCHYQFDQYGSVIDIQTKCCCCCPEEHKTQ
jgi:RNA polymerase sigma-70 factor (ECF subfamily)